MPLLYFISAVYIDRHKNADHTAYLFISPLDTTS